MTAQAVQAPVVAGAVPVALTPAAADTFQATPGGQYLLDVHNASGASINVTLVDPNSVSPAGASAFNPNVVVPVPAAAERIIVVDGTRFRDVNGNVNVQFSATATVTYNIYGPL